MKKHNEGYVMIYVLVVMVLLALVATGVLGVSLNNYKAQQAAGQQMQELYTAEGAAEQAFVELGEQSGDLIFDAPMDVTDLNDANYYELVKVTAIEAVVKLVEERIEILPTQPDLAGKNISITLLSDESIENTVEAAIALAENSFINYKCTLPFQIVVLSEDGSTEINAKVSLKLWINPINNTVPAVNEGDSPTYLLEGAHTEVTAANYDSYEIKTGVAS